MNPELFTTVSQTNFLRFFFFFLFTFFFLVSQPEGIAEIRRSQEARYESEMLVDWILNLQAQWKQCETCVPSFFF